MRIFLAGASGVLGAALLPLLVEAGHDVAAMTRTPGKAAGLAAADARPVVCDVFDLDGLVAAVRGFGPDVVVHQLTDLPDDLADLAASRAANARMRREGTRNLLAAAAEAGAERFVAQSVAWPMTGDGAAAVEEHERAVLAAHGVVVRYGQLYGPGTFYGEDPPSGPAVHVAEAARRTLPALELADRTLTIVER